MISYLQRSLCCCKNIQKKTCILSYCIIITVDTLHSQKCVFNTKICGIVDVKNSTKSNIFNQICLTKIKIERFYKLNTFNRFQMHCTLSGRGHWGCRCVLLFNIAGDAARECVSESRARRSLRASAACLDGPLPAPHRFDPRILTSPSSPAAPLSPRSLLSLHHLLLVLGSNSVILIAVQWSISDVFMFMSIFVILIPHHQLMT